MNIYKYATYDEIIDPYGTTVTKYIYGHYNSVVDTWGFKDNEGSTLINMCFEDLTRNKLTAMWDIYTDGGINITKEQFDNLWKEQNI
jgi:hypothetical protein